MFNAGLWTQLDIDMKCDLDWEEWERFSRLDGSLSIHQRFFFIIEFMKDQRQLR